MLQDVDVTRRAVLGAVARRELFREVDGYDYCWTSEGPKAMPSWMDRALRDLAVDELVVLPEKPGTRYWEIIDKTLED